MNNKEKGAYGEQLATEHLERKGYSILERNWRFSRVGEIDIIAKDKDILVFVEVKTRRTTAFGHPLEAVNLRKVTQMRKIAGFYLAGTKERFKAIRFDAVAVLGGLNPEVTHYKDIYRF